MSRFLLVTIGSHGDVHPFVGLARCLKSRGHHVRVMTNDYFRNLVESAGIDFVPMGTRELFAQWISDPDIWHSRKGPGRVMSGVAQTLRETYDSTREHAQTADVVAGSSLAMGGRIASEKYGFPYATVHLAPICVRGLIELPTLGPGVNFSRFPHWFKRKFWEGADHYMIDPMIAPAINELRSQLGLAPISRVLDQWWHAPQLTIGLWPEWFGARLADHPGQLRLTGFPLYDEADVTPMDADLAGWINSGDPPIAFTPGSAMRFGTDFFAAAAEACRKLNRRGILLTRHADQIPSRLPEGVRHVSFAPFGQLLTRVAAMVHHGGVGTTSQCLRAGCPQLIMPMTHDQPDNAARCVKLGVARVISRPLFRSWNVARKLRTLLTDARIRGSAQDISARFAGVDALTRTSELLESLAG